MTTQRFELLGVRFSALEAFEALLAAIAIVGVTWLVASVYIVLGTPEAGG